MLPTQTAAAMENVTAKTIINHMVPDSRLRRGSIVQRNNLSLAAVTELAMESAQVVTKVTSKRWYTSCMITLSGSFLCRGSWLWRAVADWRVAPEGVAGG